MMESFFLYISDPNFLPEVQRLVDAPLRNQTGPDNFDTVRDRTKHQLASSPAPGSISTSASTTPRSHDTQTSQRQLILNTVEEIPEGCEEGILPSPLLGPCASPPMTIQPLAPLKAAGLRGWGEKDHSDIPRQSVLRLQSPMRIQRRCAGGPARRLAQLKYFK